MDIVICNCSAPDMYVYIHVFLGHCSCNGEKECGIVNEGNKIYNVSQLELENLITVFTQT
jgi:hypothetical protein